MTTSRLNRRQTVALLGLALDGRVFARTSADKTVRFVLPNAVASGIDTITRSVQPALARALGQTVVIENQPGAGGIVGIQTLARAAPDGLTLGVVSNNVVIFPAVIKNLPFDLATDITPVAICGYTPIVLVANPATGAHNAREFIAYLKSKNGAANYASGGTGTILHLASEMFLDEAGVRARHIPYKGVGPMLTDLISGQVDFATAALPSVQAHLKSGALRAIGIGTARRAAAAPGIPTFVEQGLPAYVVEAWFALLAPKGLSATDARRINAAFVTAFSEPAVKDAMIRQGNVINISSVEYAQKFFKDEMARYALLVKKAGIEPE
jgi:tripartite-type tricarboxylate transporter receptor subunit TctC